jgi:protein-histidine pros-kinase
MTLDVAAILVGVVTLLVAAGAFLYFRIRSVTFQLALVRTLFRSLPYAIVVIDHDGLIVLYDRLAEETFGYSWKEVKGQPIEMLVPLNRRARHAQIHRPHYFEQPTVRRMGAGLELEIRFQHKTGILVRADVSLSPLDTSRGVYVFASIRPHEAEAES